MVGNGLRVAGGIVKKTAKKATGGSFSGMACRQHVWQRSSLRCHGLIMICTQVSNSTKARASTFSKIPLWYSQ